MTMPAPMPPDAFWSIIDRTIHVDDDPEAQMDALRAQLRALSLADIIAFEVAFRRYIDAGHCWDLWGAAFLIHGGCSDEGFAYFRRWLVSRGRRVYEAALADPDSLADYDPRQWPWGPWDFEEYYDVIGEVFRDKGGEGDVREHSEPEACLGDADLSGQPFDEDEDEDDDDALARRYPRLWARFGREPLV